MTGAEFSGVDLDLLADYVGGALDGTPDEAVVAGLITDDPAWREAHQLLSGGAGSVTTQLQALGATPEPMPADVFTRIDAALEQATADAAVGRRGSGRLSDESIATVTPIRPVPAAGEPGSDGAAVDVQPVAVQSDRRGKRARRLRWAAPVGIAAGVLAFAGFGIQWISTGSDDTQTSSVAGAAADNAAPQDAGDESAGQQQTLSTGRDYDRETLGQAGNRAMNDADQPSGSLNRSSKIAPSVGVFSADLDGPLSRLRAQEALQACLDAIATENGAGTITPQVVEFARYAGRPALVVQFTAAGGAWVWASGPDCGKRRVGADKLASVKVG